MKIKKTLQNHKHIIPTPITQTRLPTTKLQNQTQTPPTILQTTTPTPPQMLLQKTLRRKLQTLKNPQPLKKPTQNPSIIPPSQTRITPQKITNTTTPLNKPTNLIPTNPNQQPQTPKKQKTTTNKNIANSMHINYWFFVCVFCWIFCSLRKVCLLGALGLEGSAKGVVLCRSCFQPCVPCVLYGVHLWFKFFVGFSVVVCLIFK